MEKTSNNKQAHTWTVVVVALATHSRRGGAEGRKGLPWGDWSAETGSEDQGDPRTCPSPWGPLEDSTAPCPGANI